MNGKLWIRFQSDPMHELGEASPPSDRASSAPPALGVEIGTEAPGERHFRLDLPATRSLAEALQAARDWILGHEAIPPRGAACRGETMPSKALEDLLAIAQPGEIWVGDEIHHDLRPHLAFTGCQDLGKGRAYRVGDALERLPHFPLVGREEALQELLGFWATASRGRTAWLHLSGPAGIGKSRLIQEFLESLGPAARPIRVRCHPDGPSRPLDVLAQVVRALSDDPLGSLQARQDEGWALAGLLGLVPPREGLTPRHRRFMGFRALERWLRELCSEHPRIVLIEDTHWIDGDSQAWLQGWLQDLDSATQDIPLLILTASRTGLQNLTASRLRFAHVEKMLAPLAPESVRPWVEEALTGADPGTRDAVLTRSGGNPLLLQELVRMARMRGDLTRPRSDIPVEVQWDLEGRLELLPSVARRMLEAASMVGLRFEARLVEDLIASPASGPSWTGLLAQGLVEQVPGDDVQFAFTHPLFFEGVRQRLDPETQRAWHTRIASELWSGRGDLERVARHLVQGNPTSYGRDILLRAARAAIMKASWRTARMYLHAALSQSGEPAPTSLWLDLAELGLWLGEWEEAGRILDALPVPGDAEEWLRRAALLTRHLEGRGRLREAYEVLTEMHADPRAADATRAARLVLHRARIALRLGDWPLVERLTDTIRASQPALTVEEQGHRASLLGNLAYHRGHLEQAIALHREALTHRESLQDLGMSAGSWINLGTCAFELGDWDESEHCFERAHELTDRTGERWLQSLVLNNQGHLVLNRGRLEDAEKAYGAALALKRELQEPAGEAIALANLALVAWRRGHQAEAESLVEAALLLVERAEYHEVLPEVLAVEARLQQASGDEARAHRASRRILDLTAGTPARGARGSALRLLADQAGRAGRLAEAERLARECLEASEDRPRSLERGRALATWSWIARKRGLHAEALRACDEARACFQRLGARLDLAELPAWTPG